MRLPAATCYTCATGEQRVLVPVPAARAQVHPWREDLPTVFLRRLAAVGAATDEAA